MVLEVCRPGLVSWSVTCGFNNDVRLPIQLACKLVTGCEDAADEECIEFAVILVEAGVSSTPRGMISPQFELASFWHGVNQLFGDDKAIALGALLWEGICEVQLATVWQPEPVEL